MNRPVITISDQFMREMLETARPYCLIILRSGPRWGVADAERVIWEHGRRNFQLRAERKLSVVCPVTDGSDIRGIGIFNADSAEVMQIMEGDPAVQAGILTYEAHPCRGFPGDGLPS